MSWLRWPIHHVCPIALAALLAGPLAAQGAAPVVLPESARLVPVDAAHGEKVGWSLVRDGDTAVAASFQSPPTMPTAAYVFVRDAGGWSQQKRLVPNGATHGHGYGATVALSGDTLAVGAPSEDVGSGALYLYERVGGEWVRRQRLTFAGYSGVGAALAFDGQRLAVGATSSECVLILARSGSTWVLDEVVTSPSVTGVDRFGAGLALQGERLLVGARGARVGGSVAGRAFLFEHGATGWAHVATFEPDPPVPNSQFGRAVALDGDTLAVGASGWNFPAPGSVHVYSRVTGAWTLEQRSETPTGASNDAFGGALALEGERLVVGAFGGPANAHVYTRNAGAWTRTHVLEPVGLSAGARFGFSVDLSEDVVLVGAPYDAPQGSLYQFDLAPMAMSSYCLAAPNSTGAPARIGASGSTSVARNDLALLVRDCPPGAAGLFLCAGRRIEVPFASGWLCVEPFHPGIFRLGPPVQADGTGSMARPLDLGALPPGCVITVGTTWYFQLWYRDHGAGHGNLSDGLSVLFTP